MTDRPLSADLVSRLRDRGRDEISGFADDPLLNEAADEIVRLRAALEKIIPLRGSGGDIALAALHGAPRITPKTVMEQAGEAFRKTFGRDPTADRSESCWLAGYASGHESRHE